MMDKKLERVMLERELHGLDVELDVLRAQHRQVVQTIEDREGERYALECKLALLQPLLADPSS